MHTTNAIENMIDVREDIETELLENQVAQEEADQAARDILQIQLVTIKN